MKKRLLIVILVLITVFAFSLTACKKESDTLESLQNDYGIVEEGGVSQNFV